MPHNEKTPRESNEKTEKLGKHDPLGAGGVDPLAGDTVELEEGEKARVRSPDNLGPGIEPHQHRAYGDAVPGEGRTEFVSTSGAVPTEGLSMDIPTVDFATEGVRTDDIATVGFATEGVSTEGMPTRGAPTQGMPTHGVPTQGVSTEAMSTERVGPAGPSGGRSHQGPVDDDADEVLVLLDDEPEASGENFTGEVGLTTESIESIGLRSVNPLNDSGLDLEDPDLYDTEAVGERDESIGVMDEIADLATSLDPDILGAEDEEVPDFGRRYESHSERLGIEFEDDLGSSGGRRRRSRKGVFFAFASIAALAVGGYFAYPKLLEWYRPAGGEGPVVNAAGDPTSGGAEAPGGKASPVPVEPPPLDSEAEATRKVVQDRVLLATRLGLQWKEEKE